MNYNKKNINGSLKHMPNNNKSANQMVKKHENRLVNTDIIKQLVIIKTS
jgi:hypothetical protein